MVKKVKRSELKNHNKEKDYSFDNLRKVLEENKKIVYGSTGLIIILSVIFLLMPSKGEVYFSESECTTGMRVTYENTNVKFETDVRSFEGWGSGHMYFDDGYFFLYDDNNQIIETGNFKERAGPNYEYQSGILEIEVSEIPTSVGVICDPSYYEQIKKF